MSRSRQGAAEKEAPILAFSLVVCAVTKCLQVLFWKDMVEAIGSGFLISRQMPAGLDFVSALAGGGGQHILTAHMHEPCLGE